MGECGSDRAGGAGVRPRAAWVATLGARACAPRGGSGRETAMRQAPGEIRARASAWKGPSVRRVRRKPARSGWHYEALRSFRRAAPIPGKRCMGKLRYRPNRQSWVFSETTPRVCCYEVVMEGATHQWLEH